MQKVHPAIPQSRSSKKAMEIDDEQNTILPGRQDRLFSFTVCVVLRSLPAGNNRYQWDGQGQSLNPFLLFTVY